MKRRLIEEWAQFGQTIIDGAIKQWRQRPGKAIADRGLIKYFITLSFLARSYSNFEHILQTGSSFVYIKIAYSPNNLQKLFTNIVMILFFYAGSRVSLALSRKMLYLCNCSLNSFEIWNINYK